jgi:hypothetical protein
LGTPSVNYPLAGLPVIPGAIDPLNPWPSTGQFGDPRARAAIPGTPFVYDPFTGLPANPGAFDPMNPVPGFGQFGDPRSRAGIPDPLASVWRGPGSFGPLNPWPGIDTRPGAGLSPMARSVLERYKVAPNPEVVIPVRPPQINADAFVLKYKPLLGESTATVARPEKPAPTSSSFSAIPWWVWVGVPGLVFAGAVFVGWLNKRV